MMSEESILGGDCTDILAAQEPIIQLTENGVEGFEILCRLCANRSDHLISIYSEEGITNDLADKMNLYLPVKVTKSDLLPLQCCFQCASTVLTWHELVIASVEADRRLREIQAEVEKQLAEQNTETETDLSHLEPEPEKCLEPEDDRPVSTSAACLNPFRQEPEQADVNSVSLDVPAQVGKKRGRPAKNKPGDTGIKAEITNNDLTTDGEWIKSELVMVESDNSPFIANCEITEEEHLKMSPASSDVDNTEFDELDPEYDPRHLTKPIKIHSCSSCEMEFKKATELRRHLKVCQSIKSDLSDDHPVTEAQAANDLLEAGKRMRFKREYRCDYCQAITLRREELKKHVQTVHPEHFDSFIEQRHKRRSKIDQEAVNRAKVVVDDRTYYHCNECGKNLHSPYTYIWHNRIHTGERPFVCDLCGKQFRVSQGLVRHLRETHAGIKNFPCDLCGRMFATRRNVEEHRRIHTNERPYICDLCGKAFKQKASLFVHNRSHTDSFPFKCSYCNQGFRTKPPLLVHVTRHTGEKPYACDICGRCFRIKYELKRHRLIHSDDKPFSCTDCGLSFRQKRYLRNHNKINHNRITP